MKVLFHRSFSAAHRLWSDVSKCHNIHGHNYKVHITITGPLGRENRMVVPFDYVKEVVDRYDHALILDEADPNLHELGELTRVVTTPGVPTTEVLSQQIANEVAEVFPNTQRREVMVTLAETDNIVAYGSATTPEV
jgi:6-pyruvoyltetrahydropterin/6-carboxytetrahydropterin synthase